MRPESRREQLLTQSVGNELVIYDERTHEAHRLSPTAARVWQLADGERELDQLAVGLRESIESVANADDVPIDDEASLELVRLALSELNRAGLLARALPDSAVLGEPISRRQMLTVTAALLPVVASIVAPTPAMAATCQATAVANPTTVIPSGGQVVVNITALCGWQVNSQASHITPVSTTSGSGPGTVTFNVAPTPSPSARTGVIAVTFPGFTNFINLTIAQNPQTEPVATTSVPSATTTVPPTTTTTAPTTTAPTTTAPTTTTTSISIDPMD
jgi:hypothetical protein